MDFQFLLTALITLAIIEVVSDVLKKTPLWLSKQCVAAFRRLWQESKYLYGIVKKKRRFAQWNPEAGRYVALRANAESAKRKIPEHVLDSLESFLGNGESVVLLGEPGAGKTTVLEALTYRLARRAYCSNILLWFGLSLVAALLLWVAPALSLAWLASFFLWESLARRATIPLFLEARSDYRGEKVDRWYAEILKEHLGEAPLLGSHHHVVFLIDGVNEVRADLYGTFREGWRALLENPRSPRVVFNSRTDEDPTLSLGLEESNTLILRHLDDDGVREFLQVYGRKKAADEGKSYPPEQTTRDFAELQDKKLLDEKGIGRNPYWLRMMVESGLYTRNRGAIFRSFAEKLIAREIEEKPEERKRRRGWEKIVPLDIEMDALAGPALVMHQQQSTGFTGEAGWQKARAAIRERLGDDSLYSPDDVLGEAEAATLVRTRYKERIEFTHQLLQEFFAAYALRMEERWDEALQHCEDPGWWQTLLLLGNLLDTSESGVSSETWAKFTRRVLGDGQNVWRVFLAIGLMQIAEAPEKIKRTVLNALETSIGEELTETQVRAIHKLTSIIGEEAAEVFAPLLEWGRNSSIQRKGVAILRAVGGKRAAELLLSTLYTPDLHEVGTAALIAIGEPAMEPLIAMVVETDNLMDSFALLARWQENVHDVRKRAAEALRQISSPAIETLVTVLRGEVEVVWYARTLAARALKEGLLRSYEDAFPILVSGQEARYRAIEALGQMGIAAIEPLITALQDEDVRVREGAVEALGKIGTPAVSALVNALQDKDWRVRATAAYALGQIGDSRAVEPLIVTLRDRERRVRATAVRALGQISDPSTLGPLNKAMRDRVKSVRLEAAAILSRTGDPRATELLVDALGSRDRRIREKAKEAIVKVGSPVVEMLIPMLQARNWKKRFDAVDVLGQIGDPRAVGPLIAVLQNKSYGVPWWVVVLSRKLADEIDLRQKAAEALGQIGSPDAIEALSIALRDENAYLRYKAVEALGQIGDPRVVEPLIIALQDEDADVRAQAAAALGDINDPRAVEPLIALLQDEGRSIDWRKVFWKAVEALGKIGDPRAVGPMLNAWCKQSEHRWSRDGEKDVAKALGQIGALAVEPLMAALRNKNWCVRFCAMVALGNIGDPRAVEPMIAVMRDEDVRGVHERAENTLVQIGAPAVKPLIAALGDENNYVRSLAGSALVRIGTSAVKPLIAALQDSHVGVRERAAQTLGEVGDPRAVEPLIAILQDPEMDVRWQATWALVQIGALAVESLIAVLHDDDVRVRHAAAMALGYIGDSRAVQPLIAALQDEDGHVRWQARFALGKIGVPAIKPLITALRDEDWQVWQMAAEALGQIGDMAVEPLIVVLRSCTEKSQARQGAAIALGKIRDPRAVKSLLATLQDKDADMRYEAVRALGQIGDPRALPELERIAREDTGNALQGNVANAAREAVEQIRQRMQ